jgi:hypothetical protein
MIDWSKQPFEAHYRLMADIMKQIKAEWHGLPWWKRAWITITRKSVNWKRQQLLKRYKAETKITEWGKEMLG